MKQDIRPFEVQRYTPSVHNLTDTDIYEPSAFRSFVAIGMVVLAGYGVYNYYQDNSVKSKTNPEVSLDKDSANSSNGMSDKYNPNRDFANSQQQFKTNINDLLDEISAGEGLYDSINTGDAGDTRVGEKKYHQIFGNRVLTELTIQEVLNLQASGKIFAKGRWQIIKGTLAGAVKNTGIDTNRLYDESSQRELATYLILGGIKRPNLTKFLKGGDVSVEKAFEDLCAEWASVPCNDGLGRYDDDKAKNKAYGGLKRANHIKKLMIKTRAAYLLGVEAITNQPPKITIIGDSLTVGYDKLANIASIDKKYGLEIVKVDAKKNRSLIGGNYSGLQAIEDNQHAIAESDITVVGLGTNDNKTDEQFREGLDFAITRINEFTRANSDAKIGLIENYSNKDEKKNIQSRNNRNRILNQVAKYNQKVFIIHIDDSDLKYAQDGIHLTEEGYIQVSGQILTQLQQNSKPK